jgi:anaphase-promoting complex subunit 4
MPYTNRTTDTDTDTDTDTPNLITYSPPTPAGTDASPRLLPFGSAAPASLRHRVRIDAAAVRAHTRHVFEAHFTPLRLVVNGRKGRRVVVVLGSDRRHYRVLDLDYGEERARDVDGEEEEGEEEEGDVEMGGA